MRKYFEGLKALENCKVLLKMDSLSPSPQTRPPPLLLTVGGAPALLRALCPCIYLLELASPWGGRGECGMGKKGTIFLQESQEGVSVSLPWSPDLNLQSLACSCPLVLEASA